MRAIVGDISLDLSYALRSVRRAPGASAVCVIILALAIGANVALFTFLDTYAFRKLPIPAADRYVELIETNERNERSHHWTLDEFTMLEQGPRTLFEGLYASTFFQATMLEPEKRFVSAQAVSSRFFSLTGAQFALGRAFSSAEERGAEFPVVLSDIGWRRLVPSGHTVLGRTIRLGRISLTVVGVTAPGFRGVEPVTPELWMPLAAHAAVMQRTSGTLRYDVAGLLAPGVTPESAAALGSGIVAGFQRSLSAGSATQRRLSVEHRRSLLDSDAHGQLRTIGVIVLCAFGLVLLIACANLASLYVARASARHREIATRLSLGASVPRLIRQLLTESLVLALAGALLGCALAGVGIGFLHDWLFSIATGSGLTVAPVEIRATVVAFTVLLGVLAGLSFGLLPALEATSTNLASAGRRDSFALGGRIRPQRLTGLLVTVQVTASLVLLVLSSLMLRAADNASRLDPGYDISTVVDLRFPLPTTATLDRLRRDPRITVVSSVLHTPLSGSMPRQSLGVDGKTLTLRYNYVDDAYFDILGIRLATGRSFRRDEAINEAPVVVISQKTASDLWPGQNAVGRTLELSQKHYTVIGIAPDVVSGFFFEGRDRSAVYFPSADPVRTTEILVRTHPGARLREVCDDIDPAVLCSPTTLREVARVQRFPFVAGSAIASALGTLALTLTTIGLYGIVSFAVSQRTRELGLRMALGATPGQNLRLVLRRAMMTVGIGLVLGFPVAIVMLYFAARYFSLNAYDPVALGLVPSLLAATAFTAALIPAFQAARVDPAESLRAD